MTGKDQHKDGISTDALALLKADHDKMKAWLRAVARGVDNATEDEDEDDRRRAVLVDDICNALTIHAMIEEEIFYPALRSSGADDGLLDEAEAEHAGVRELVGQLEVIYPGDEHFEATIAVLAEELDQHIETEELEIFDAARGAGIDLEALGARMAARKAALETDLSAPAQTGLARAGTRRGRPTPN